MMNQKNDYVSSRTNLSRACVFIDSSNPAMPYQVIDSKVHPLIKLPFPPVIDPIDLVVQHPNGNNIPARAPNAFIIYRKVFIDAAHVDGYHLPMRIMSSMASQSWEQEPDTVKTEYRRLASEAFNLRNEMYPKTGCKRKRAKWNIVSFKNKNKVPKKRQKWNIVSFDSKDSNSENSKQNKSDESKESVENQSENIQQTTPSLTMNNKEEDFLSSFDDIFPSPEMNFDMSINVNEIPSNNAFNQDFAYQTTIPSPDLSIASSFSPELNQLIDQIEYDLDFCYPGQSLDGIINQNEEQINFHQIKNIDPFNYYQSPEFIDNPTFVCNNNDNENLSNENISSPDSFVNYQPDNIETVPHFLNYFSDGLGISNSEPSIKYFL